MNKSTQLLIMLLTGLVILAACSTTKTSYSPPPVHPPEAELEPGRPLCTECHDARDENVAYENFNHTAYFGEDHRQVAYQSSNICSICHAESFCSDCHTTSSELKPSLRDQSRTDRLTPHRGDFVSRHLIEAKVDPTSCYRCHGNPRSAQSCVPCHG